MQVPQLNLFLAWLWILLGFASGMILGMFFHEENWLGGYASYKRRLYRLAHISFFGLGVLNLCFYLSLRSLLVDGLWVALAGWALVCGALTMPLCCILMAQSRRLLPIFAVPVLALLFGGAVTCGLVLRSQTTFEASGKLSASPSAADPQPHNLSGPF